MVVRRADLNDIHPDDGELEANPPHRIQQFARRQTTRLRGAGAGSVSWITHTSMSTERNTPSHSSVAMANASVKQYRKPRCTISVISKDRICCDAIQSSVSGGGQ